MLSRGALRLFAEKGFSSSGGGGGEEVSLGAATAPCISPNVEIAEDLAMGDCMFKLRVWTKPERFLPLRTLENLKFLARGH